MWLQFVTDAQHAAYRDFFAARCLTLKSDRISLLSSKYPTHFVRVQLKTGFGLSAPWPGCG
jgi:hypothetical protein